MSETYLVPGNSTQGIPTGAIAAQIFRPHETHALWFIDIDVYSLGIISFPKITINQVLYDGTPADEPLFDMKDFLRIRWKYFGPVRIRYLMRGGTLQKDIDYALLVYGHLNPLMPVESWRYVKATGGYPRGYRLFKASPTADWQKFESDDHIFGEFGKPPVPPPPPEPPIPNFTVLDLQYHPSQTGYIIHVATNVPCHLYFVYTMRKPNKNKESIMVRGLPTKDALRYCFVDFEHNEQEEPGDTIYHTFIKEPWPFCQVRWFTFRAIIEGVWAASVGPIFMKHMDEIPYDMLILEQWTYKETSPPDFTRLILEEWTS